MPDSIVGVLIIIIAIFPGFIGDYIYRILVGVDWREKELRGIIRLVGFSVVGVTLYALVAELFKLPPPLHIFPATFSSISIDHANLSKIFIPYFGHLIGGSLSGLLSALGAKLLAKYSSHSAYPTAWDDFIRSYVQGHWVVLGLESGDVYAGKLRIADISSATDERDLVLEEPALYNPETKEYVATSYQYLFIKSKNLYSIAVVNEPESDKRIIPIGQTLFKQGGKNES